MVDTLLQVEGLMTYIESGAGLVKAVDGVTFSVARGEIVGLVGESGCGKTTAALSVMRLLPEPYTRIAGGSIMFEGEDLVSSTEQKMREIRGNRISMIFQDPLTALNPIMTVGDQIAESITAHHSLNGAEAWTRTIELLNLVGIADGHIVANAFPFQISGGMRQRVMIAMAMSGHGSLLIADEPTTNLDVSIQAQILELIRGIRDKTGTAILLITHNLGIVSWLCDRTYVMYAGKIVEQGSTEQIFSSPKHPYTSLLLRSVPQVAEKRRLETIPGEVPSLVQVPSGCRFNPRCPYRKDICRVVEPELIEVEPRHDSRCLMYDPEQKGIWNS